jgi:hypothetical protein
VAESFSPRNGPNILPCRLIVFGTPRTLSGPRSSAISGKRRHASVEARTRLNPRPEAGRGTGIEKG